MTKKMKKKNSFPIGIFLFMFIIESVLGLIALTGYSVLSLKKNLSGIEEYTINYSRTMAEAFARVAELSIRTDNYISLKTLFQEKIQQNTIDEAMFVLADGRLIVHSNTAVEKGLAGNIANDQMAYNLDLILEPVIKNNKELIFNNYNIINTGIPFSRPEMEVIRKYIYPDITTSGWLFTRGVFTDGKAAGSVCFLVSKGRIHQEIQSRAVESLYILYVVLAVSLLISLFVSFIIMLRYRQTDIQELSAARAAKSLPSDSAEEMNIPEIEAWPMEEVVSTNITTGEEQGTEKNMADEFEQFVEEPDNSSVIEKEFEIPVSISGHDTGGESSKEVGAAAEGNDDGYITVEFLGEINEENEEMPAVKQASGEYIARPVPADVLKRKGISEIRDAVPVAKRR